MYAVVRTGGKQVRMQPGESVRVEKLDGSVGDSIELDEVMLVGGGSPEGSGAPEGSGSPEGSSAPELKVGTPVVDGARVVGTIIAQGRGPKITVFKMKRRKGYRRKIGHRQDYTEILVDRIDS